MKFSFSCSIKTQCPSFTWNSVQMRIFSVFLGVLLIFQNVCGEGKEVPLNFQDILPENPTTYDKMSPPKQNGNPTVVHFHVTVMSLDSIDESSMTYVADIFFLQSWKDHRLRLPDNLTGEYRLLPVTWLREIWRPDAFFKNAKKVTFQDMTIPNHYVWLYQDKKILYSVKLNLLLSCSMKFQSYPHDTQQCSMKIESLSHTTDDLVFQWDPEMPPVIDAIELPQLDLAANSTGDCTQVYATGNFTCLEFVFTFRRRLGYYLFHTYVPTCLIVIMSWISFWIRPEAVPARVTLGVTSLLTLSTQHANSQKSLPPVSYVKAIDIFMSTCTVFVFCSLMEYALVNVVMGDVVDVSAANPQAPLHRNRTTKWTFFRNSTRTSCAKTKSPVTSGSESGPAVRTEDRITSVSIQQHPVVSMKNRQEDLRKTALIIDRFSRVFFPISFLILNILYWAVFVVFLT